MKPEKFIRTSNKGVAVQLIKDGFTLVSHVGDTYLFLNSDEKYVFSKENKDIDFTSNMFI